MPTVQAEQHARHPDFPEAIPHRTAQQHAVCIICLLLFQAIPVIESIHRSGKTRCEVSMKQPKSYVRTDEHGVIRVGDSRVMLDSVVTSFQQGQRLPGISPMPRKWLAI